MVTYAELFTFAIVIFNVITAVLAAVALVVTICRNIKK